MNARDPLAWVPDNEVNPDLVRPFLPLFDEHIESAAVSRVVARVAPVEPVVMWLQGTPGAVRRALGSFSQVTTLTGLASHGTTQDGRIQVQVTVTRRLRPGGGQ